MTALDRESRLTDFINRFITRILFRLWGWETGVPARSMLLCLNDVWDEPKGLDQRFKSYPYVFDANSTQRFFLRILLQSLAKVGTPRQYGVYFAHDPIRE